MSNLTERLLQIAAVTFILWFGYGLVERSVISIIQARSQANVAIQQLQDCQRSMPRGD